MSKNIDLTNGNITKGLWSFALPLMLGNVFQQLYNLADTWVVGKFIGDNALAAVGSSYTLMTFLTSVIIGLCLGSSSFTSMMYGKKNINMLRNGLFSSFVIIGTLSVFVMVIFYAIVDVIIKLLQIPAEIYDDTKKYLVYVFIVFFAVFIYNYIANTLRAIGNSVFPLIFLSVSVILNIFLDLFFVLILKYGIIGAAVATVISQYVSAIGIFIYYIIAYPEYRIKKGDMNFNKNNIKNILSLSGFTCLQQSVMNFGILMVQGLVNSFGANVMAAFAVAVKIDTIAYMPVQDFGNAFSVFTAQNYGAGKNERIKSGIKQAVLSIVVFCLIISSIVFIFSENLMQVFVDSSSAEIIKIGTQYLKTEGSFYIGIGILFMLYGYFRAINKPAVSVVLTVLSLGIRVLLAYVLSAIPSFGVMGIWISIPIGWFIADFAGVLIGKKNGV